jgi:hypothetical protein
MTNSSRCSCHLQRGSDRALRELLKFGLCLAQINRQFNQFTKRVQTDIWERDFGSALLPFATNACWVDAIRAAGVTSRIVDASSQAHR